MLLDWSDELHSCPDSSQALNGTNGWLWIETLSTLTCLHKVSLTHVRWDFLLFEYCHPPVESMTALPDAWQPFPDGHLDCPLRSCEDTGGDKQPRLPTLPCCRNPPPCIVHTHTGVWLGLQMHIRVNNQKQTINKLLKWLTFVIHRAV